MSKDYLIEKWLNGELNASEQEAFEKLDDYQLYADIIDNTQFFKSDNFSNIDDFETFKKNYNSQNPQINKQNWLMPVLRFAAMLVIAFGVYFAFFNTNLVEVRTLASEKTTIELPDQSEITLNALSEIAYDKGNWDENRRIELYGEAFFKVAKGEKFDVITEDGSITVVGTAFNVKQRDDYFEVKCFEGIVLVVSNSIERKLSAGDTYKILNGNFTSSITNSLVPSWTTNVSSFKELPLKEVIDELKRQYNINVTTDNDVNINRLFTGGFTHEDIESALIAITQPMNLTYEMNASNSVVIHDSKK